LDVAGKKKSKVSRDMAELAWKGKQRIQSGLSGYEQSTTSSPYQLITKEMHAPPSTDAQPSPHAADNWYNRLILGDKDRTLPALLAEFAGSVNLIYIDPPFMTGRTFTGGPQGEQIAYSDTWNNDIDTYLQWLYDTFTLLYALLATTGSLYVHLDWRVCHYAKIVLDEIFGFNPRGEGPGFKNEIIWHYQSGGNFQKYYARKHDVILLYTKSAQYCFHGERVAERRGAHKRNHMRKEIGPDGRVLWTIRSGGRTYSYHEDTTMAPSDVWSDISHLHQRDPERVGYATQKPATLLERIILTSSEEHDLVLDCFCGSGVTPVVADRNERRWIACDQSELAIALTNQRLTQKDFNHPFVLQQVIADI